MSTLQVGKVIYETLSTDNDVAARVGKKIFPLVANEKTTFPFIVYRRGGLQENSDTKDRLLFGEEASIDVIIAADTYNESIELAEYVRVALLGKRYTTTAGYRIGKVKLYDAIETFQDDTFLQTLKFNIKISE